MSETEPEGELSHSGVALGCPLDCETPALIAEVRRYVRTDAEGHQVVDTSSVKYVARLLSQVERLHSEMERYRDAWRSALGSLAREREAAMIAHRERDQARAALAATLRIVAQWVASANDGCGLDADDLAWSLHEAGYPLPDLGAPEPDDATPEGSREDVPAGGVDWTDEEEGDHWDRELMERVAQGGSVDMGELRTQLPVLLEELDEVTAEAERERARAAEAERALERHTSRQIRQALGAGGDVDPSMRHILAWLLGGRQPSTHAAVVLYSYGLVRIDAQSAEGDVTWGLTEQGRRIATEAAAEDGERKRAAGARACRHADSLYGRCAACGMTWQQQARQRAEADQ